MIRLFAILMFLSSQVVSIATAQDLYFQKKTAIIRWSNGKKIDTIWQAPFSVNDISLSQDCQFICFTKSVVNDNSRSEREVGYYSLIDKKFTIIKSNTLFNYGAIMSPSNELIAFSYLPGRREWKTALYNRIKNTLNYDVAPSIAGDAYNAFSWHSDSLLCFATLDKIIEKNIHDSTTKMFTPPDSEMSFTVPGTQMLFLNDTAFAFVCADVSRQISAEFDGPPTNVFLTISGSTERLFSKKEDVNACFISNKSIYIGYTDYALSKKGREMLVRYDIRSKKKELIKSLGLLIGVSHN